jgi:hypothetical protein
MIRPSWSSCAEKPRRETNAPSNQLLERLRAELDALPADDEADDGDNGGRSLAVAAVQEVLERHGLSEAALEAVGYKVERESLLEARVVRLRRSLE